MLAAACLATAGPAGAATPTGSSGGGATFVVKPEVVSVSCVARCASHRRARAGSILRIAGRGLGAARSVLFLGGSSRGDEASTQVRRPGSRRLSVEVPASAVSGPVVVVVSRTLRSRRSRSVAILPPPPPQPSTPPGPGTDGHVFPVRGRHDYGGAGAGFGAGRDGRLHQGHDVFARCGTPLVAARGGRVQYARYHRAAGYYLVIDGTGTGTDYAYMHLAERSPFRSGDPVSTGQRIGSVGKTGNARGCHLHFELWGTPGWHAGGRPFDPLPLLRTWDSWS